ncbi:hypothetical protein [Streptomyces sp. WAC06614]|uniref:hypothetical protein n=1 Tax=Streptomyces sp. WAC06614 TaxID=2487416 RepID=UPI000F7A0427|nr:hypothetical protein [Streptomyces sp. WAC06614]RSS76744.1 hypothetical protein EF918_23110 [Streptomyces sp. WAC06614]
MRTVSRRRWKIVTGVALALLSVGCSSTINQQGGTNVNCGDTANCGNLGGNHGASPDGGAGSPSRSASPSPSDSDADDRNGTRTPSPASSPRPGGTPSATVSGKSATDLSAYPTATVYANGAPLFRVVWVETPKNEVHFTGVGRTQIRARGVEGVGYHMRLASTAAFRVSGTDGTLDYGFVAPDSRLIHVRHADACPSNCPALNPTGNGSALPYTTILQVQSGRLSGVPAGSVMTYRLE